jgi:transposase
MDAKGFWMSTKELDRYTVIERVLARRLRQVDAAQQLGLSVRQIKRLCAAVRRHGVGALVSVRRGKPSNRSTPPERKQAIVDLLRQHYSDFGPRLASEYLEQEHEHILSVETVRTWMTEAGLWQPKERRAKRMHSPRERRARLGELVQIDGSHHDWFEGRAPKACLIAFIDDATGRLLGARFSPTETTQAYFDVLHSCVQTHGAPLALYSDRHSIFTKHDPEDALPTQFERALGQLSIEPIQARSPQAKGRVERLFQTLQDRMVKAMRLAGISTIEQANAWLEPYLQKHNEQFAVPARDPQDAHRPYTDCSQALARICAMHHQRQLSSQLSCQFEGAILQLDRHQAHAPKGRARVDIVQHGDGRIELLYAGHVLSHRGYEVHPHLRVKRTADDKNLNTKVDAVVYAERRRVAKLMAQLEHQATQRSQGIHTPDIHPSPPPRAGSARYGLRPSRADPALVPA